MCAAGRVRATVRIWFFTAALLPFCYKKYNKSMKHSRVKASFNLTESNIGTEKKNYISESDHAAVLML